MNLAYDRFRLHAYVDGELTPDEVADFERLLAQDPVALAEVAALRAQNNALHERYDALLTAPLQPGVQPGAGRLRRGWSPSWDASRGMVKAALAASLLAAAGVGGVAGWIARAPSERQLATSVPVPSATEGRLQAFVQTASISHAVFVPEVRHPVEVAAADEAHLVAWLSKRLGAPLVVPHLGDAGWDLLGGRLLPERSGPVAQFMYQDHGGRRMTLAVSNSVADPTAEPATRAAANQTASFRIAEENGSTVFYWIDADYAYALTGKLTRSEMTALASRVYRQLDR